MSDDFPCFFLLFPSSRQKELNRKYQSRGRGAWGKTLWPCLLLVLINQFTSIKFCFPQTPSLQSLWVWIITCIWKRNTCQPSSKICNDCYYCILILNGGMVLLSLANHLHIRCSRWRFLCEKAFTLQTLCRQMCY